MKRVFAMLLIAAACFAVESGDREHRYKILNVTGPVSGREGDFRLHLHGGFLTVENKRLKRNFDIAGEQITEVVYTPVRFTRAEQNPIPIASGGCYGCGGEVLLYVAAALILAPMHGHSHYVRITWNDRNVEQQIQFEIGKNDYLPLLESLKHFSGVKYIDVEEQARRVHHELEQNAGKAVLIQLEHASRVGAYDINGGKYRLVALDRSSDISDIYLFCADDGRKLDVSQLKATAHATIAGPSGDNAIDYDGDSFRILKIAADGRSYRLDPAN